MKLESLFLAFVLRSNWQNAYLLFREACNLCFRSEIFKDALLFNSLTTVKVSVTIPFYTFKLYFSECTPTPIQFDNSPLVPIYSPTILLLSPYQHVQRKEVFGRAGRIETTLNYNQNMDIQHYNKIINQKDKKKHLYFQIHKSLLYLHFFLLNFYIFFYMFWRIR